MEKLHLSVNFHYLWESLAHIKDWNGKNGNMSCIFLLFKAGQNCSSGRALIWQTRIQTLEGHLLKATGSQWQYQAHSLGFLGSRRMHTTLRQCQAAIWNSAQAVLSAQLDVDAMHTQKLKCVLESHSFQLAFFCCSSSDGSGKNSCLLSHLWSRENSPDFCRTMQQEK